MPAGRPTVGELWQSVDSEGRTVRGIIAEITQSIATLVSVTGNRYRLAPSRLLASWAYEAPAPRTPFICSRSGCSAAAVFRYSRGTSPDYVCPRHAPSGTRLELLSNSPVVARPTTTSRVSQPCPSCSNPDPIEDRGTSTEAEEIIGWSCLRCNNRWLTIQPGETTTMFGHWWLDMIHSAIASLDRQNRPAGIIEAHPSAHAEILRNIMSPGHVAAQDSSFTIGNQTALWGIPLVANGNLEHFSVLIRPSSMAAAAPGMMEILQTREMGDTLVRSGSRWLNRAGGRSVEVSEVKDDVVTFRQEGQPFHMVLEDFLSLHRPFVLDDAPPEPLSITVLPDEEYESAEGLVRILSVDSKRELVEVLWPDGRKRMPLQLREFATSKWRKIERRTAYQRIMDDEDD